MAGDRKLNAQTKTKMQRKGSDYAMYANMFASTEEEKKLCTDLNNALNKLNQLVDDLTKEVNGAYKQLDDDSLTKLRAAYAEVAKYSGQYKEKDGKITAFNKAVKQINDFIGKDLQALQTVSGKDGLSFTEAISSSRNRVINLGDQKTSKVGGAMSQRIPLSYDTKNGKRAGMFTKNSFYNPNKDILAFFKGWVDRDPSLQDFYNGIKELTEQKENIVTDLESINCQQRTKGGPFVFWGDGENPCLKYFEALNGRDDMETLKAEFTAFIEPLSLLEDKYGYSMGSEIGAPIDKRNSAMTFVSDMMGCPDLIARSTPMTVIMNGEKAEGTFMEFAEGVDVNNLHPEDKFWDVEPENFDHCIGLKSVANLAVLDYICGNIDRHVGNMFYQFGGEDGKTFLGVKGIDNDMSFGSTNDKALTGQSIRRLTPIDQIKVIGKDAANALTNLSVSAFELGLKGYGLSPLEIYAASERLKRVQEGIANGNIKAVSDEEWLGMTMEELEQNDGTFHQIRQNVQLGKATLKQDMEEKLKNEEGKHIMPKGTKEIKEDNLKAMSEKLDKLYKNLKTNNEGFFIGSKQYDSALIYTEYAKNEFAKMLKEQQENPVRTQEEKNAHFEKVQNILGNLGAIATIYTDYKIDSNSANKNERSRNRSLAMLDLRHFCDNNVQKHRLPDDRSYKMSNDELRKAAYKQVKPKELLNMVKRMKKLGNSIEAQEAKTVLNNKIAGYLNVLGEMVPKDDANKAEKKTSVPQMSM